MVVTGVVKLEARTRYKALYYTSLLILTLVYLITVWCLLFAGMHLIVTFIIVLFFHSGVIFLALKLPIIQARAGMFQTLTEGPVYAMTVELLQRAGLRLKQIQVFVKPVKACNAIVNGYRGSYYIIITQPLLEILSSEELRAIMAHEVAHIKHNDGMKRFYDLAAFVLLPVGLLTIAALLPKDSLASNLVGVTGVVAFVGLFLRWLSNSRKGEYAADRYAAELINDRETLIRALTILNEKSRFKTDIAAYRWPLLTHPDLNSRIANLRKA